MPRQASLLTAVVAEKPSVGRDLARLLGAGQRGQGYLHGNGYVVTWAVGHLVALAEPHQIRPEWKRWRRADLPILPPEWPLIVYEQTKDQFEVVRRILTSPKVGRIVCATDAGREGELIFRYIYEAAGSGKPVERLWISSLTPEAIRKGFARLRPAAEFDRLADAARARSRADWLVGMNLSRCYSLDYDQDLSVGRVQTPTLALLVERELEIRNFVPEDYLEVQARFRLASAQEYEGVWFRLDADGKTRLTRLPADGEEARAVVGRVQSGKAEVESVERETRRLLPPLLYDLTELQRHANRLYGYSAENTLQLAQSLYEKHKLITYPRTDSRHLSTEVEAELPGIVRAIRGPYEKKLAAGTGERPLGKRYVDDAKVSDHHAIIPTGKSAERLEDGSGEARLYDLICRRLLSAWHEPHIFAVTTVITAVTPAGGGAADRFHSSGTSIEQEGWKALDVAPERSSRARPAGTQAEAALLPAGLKAGQAAVAAHAEAVKKTTRPPKRFTEATLLTAMESAGQTLDDKALSEAMKERGLGTPATRAQIIETLLKRQYLVRRKKTLEATDKGIRLIEVVHPAVKSASMTGEWEARLKAIERGEAGFAEFMRRIEDYVREVVGGSPPAATQSAGAAPAPGREPAPGASEDMPSPEELRAAAALFDDAPRLAETNAVPRAGPAGPPVAGPLRRAKEAPRQEAPLAPAAAREAPAREPRADSSQLGELLRSAFGFSSFRPHQEEVCRAVTEGRDVLLVMPTGAGKSLCYQLPGFARGGATLVLSPLIALMEDQVEKLRQQGLRAERIHSHRGRQESRQVCQDYLAGQLDFLYIAPERLSVPGFIEMLAKRKLSLIAVDEAHCISHWGHDFRPEYRMLGQRLPQLRPAPVIALTATATPLVQQDIVEQLGLENPLKSIHGFRRDNIAIEVIDLLPSQRPAAVLRLLQEPANRPAIIYAPSRKATVSLADEVKTVCGAAAYHAGMTAISRDSVQAGFNRGRYEVIVATIAFGMGVDKPDVRTVIHTGLPGSVEGYYQEIGRAGRDGLPSRAVLMHSWNDRKTHEFFFGRDYPELDEMRRIYRSLGRTPISKDALGVKLGVDPDTLDKALEKLWIHGGAVVDPEENITRGEPHWETPYLRQRDYKQAQLEQMSRYTESMTCRMLQLVRHFGDEEDSQRPCERCDVCAPQSCGLQQYRKPTAGEAEALNGIVQGLKETGNAAVGKIYRELFEGSPVDRRDFERLLAGLVRAGFARLWEDSFEKDGRVIEYRRVALTREGRELDGAVEQHVLLPKAMPKPEPASRRRAAAAKSKTRKPGKRQSQGASGTGAERQTTLLAALKAWRLSEARRLGVPAFQIMHNRALDALARAAPESEEELLAVHGIGPKLVQKYGRKVLAIVANAGGASR